MRIFYCLFEFFAKNGKMFHHVYAFKTSDARIFLASKNETIHFFEIMDGMTLVKIAAMSLYLWKER